MNIQKRSVTAATDKLNGGNVMYITVNSGVNADGFSVDIVNSETDERLFFESYHYGYNASYSKAHAEHAHKDVEDAKKYGWSTTYTEKPFVTDIINELCAEYDVSSENIIVQSGKNRFTGGNVDDATVRDFKESYLSASTSVKAANYGGAYDIEDDMFFTKDDIVELANDVVDHLNNVTPNEFKIVDVYMSDPTRVVLTVEDFEGTEYEAVAKIDMRKIKKPADILKYSGTLSTQILDECDPGVYSSVEVSNPDSVTSDLPDDYVQGSDYDDVYMLFESIHDDVTIFAPSADILLCKFFADSIQDADKQLKECQSKYTIASDDMYVITYRSDLDIYDASNPYDESYNVYQDLDTFFKAAQKNLEDWEKHESMQSDISEATQIVSSDYYDDYYEQEAAHKFNSWKLPEISQTIDIEFEDEPVWINDAGELMWTSDDKYPKWCDELEVYFSDYPNTSVTDLIDGMTIADDAYSILEPMMPRTPGKYIINGTATLIYDVSGLRQPPELVEYDECDVSDATAKFNYTQSGVSDFSFVEA